MVPVDILLVEDDSDERDILAALLRGQGFSVTEAVDGLDALARLDEQRPRLVVLDLLMPRLSGWELLSKLQASPAWKDIPVVVLSAWQESQEVLGGAHACLTKPVEVKLLVAILKEAMAKVRA